MTFQILFVQLIRLVLSVLLSTNNGDQPFSWVAVVHRSRPRSMKILIVGGGIAVSERAS